MAYETVRTVIHPNNLESVAGKTVSEDGVAITENLAAIHFTDGTTLLFNASKGWGDSAEIEVDDSPPHDLGDAVQLGFISYEERDRLVKKSNDDAKAADEARERAQYERLKAKYEPQA